MHFLDFWSTAPESVEKYARGLISDLVITDSHSKQNSES